eukprot:919203-Rhodomonas_salina.1
MKVVRAFPENSATSFANSPTPSQLTRPPPKCGLPPGMRLVLSQQLLQPPRPFCTNLIADKISEVRALHSHSTPASLPAPSSPI